MRVVMNRADKRAHARKTKAKKNTIKGIATLGAASLFVAMASTGANAAGDGIDYVTGDTNLKFSAESWKEFGSYTEGLKTPQMSGGITSLKVSDDQLATLEQWKAAGVNIDFEDSLAKTNASLTDPYGRDGIGLSISIDEGKVAAMPESKKINANGYKVIAANGDYAGNMSSKALMEGFSYKQGDRLDLHESDSVIDYESGDTSETNNSVDENGTFFAAYANPISSFIKGGVKDTENGSNYIMTSISDIYSDGDSVKRLADVSMGGTQRGLDAATTVNCIKTTCVIPLTLVAHGNYGDAPLDNNGNPMSESARAVLDTLYIEAESTWSAGKTPVYTKANPLVQEDGTKVWLNPSKAPDYYGEYFNTKNELAPWLHADELAAIRAEKLVVPEKTATLKYISIIDGMKNGNIAWGVAEEIGSGVQLTKQEIDPKNPKVVTFTFESSAEKWTLFNTEEAKVGFAWSVGEGNHKIISVEKGKMVVQTTSNYDLTDVGWENVGQLDTGITAYLPWYDGYVTPTYTVAYELPKAPPVVEEKDPSAKNDYVKGIYGNPVNSNIVENDTTSTTEMKFDSASRVFLDPADDKYKKSVTTNEGTYTINDNGTETFVHAKDFGATKIQKTAPLTYQATEVDKNGVLGKKVTATVQFEITPAEKPVIPEEKPKDPVDVPDDSTIPEETPEEPVNVPDDSTIPEEIIDNGDGDGGGQIDTGDGDGSGDVAKQSIQETGADKDAAEIAKTAGIAALILSLVLSVLGFFGWKNRKATKDTNE